MHAVACRLLLLRVAVTDTVTVTAAAAAAAAVAVAGAVAAVANVVHTLPALRRERDEKSEHPPAMPYDPAFLDDPSLDLENKRAVLSREGYTTVRAGG